MIGMKQTINQIAQPT